MNTTKMTDSEAERLELAQRFLENRYCYLAAQVSRLGELQFSDAIQTACIVASGEKVRLYFNRRFFNEITVMELAGVLIHEAFHFCLRHQPRYQAIPQQLDRRLFLLAIEACVNDLIVGRIADLRLPGSPITGETLLGRGWNVSNNSAEEVAAFLRELLADQPALTLKIHNLDSIDDHSPWEDADRLKGEPPRWTDETSQLVDGLVGEYGFQDRLWGSGPRGCERILPGGGRPRLNLARFLAETIRTKHYTTDWSRPNRKLVSIYPQVVLPSYEPRNRFQVVMALDASGSVPPSFLAAALAVARQPLAESTVTLLSFDTEVYPVSQREPCVRGGGGTSVGPVEAFIGEKMTAYPETVFCLTDGYFPRPQLRYPRRWVWILPPWGTRENIPEGGRVEIFDSPLN